MKNVRNVLTFTTKSVIEYVVAQSDNYINIY